MPGPRPVSERQDTVVRLGGTIEIAGAVEQMPQLVPAVRVVGVERDGLAIGGEGLACVVQERLCADVPGRRRALRRERECAVDLGWSVRFHAFGKDFDGFNQLAVLVLKILYLSGGVLQLRAQHALSISPLFQPFDDSVDIDVGALAYRNISRLADLNVLLALLYSLAALNLVTFSRKKAVKRPDSADDGE